MKKQVDPNFMLKGNLWKVILTLAIPIVINSLLQTMYNLTDTYWIGKIGKDSMAAITAVTPIQNIVISFGQGITVAGAILISQFLGADDTENAKSMVSQLFSCAMIFSIIMASICFASAKGLIVWLGAEGEVLKQGTAYLRIVILDMPFLFLINLFTAVNQSKGDTVRPMFLNLLGIVLNLIMDPLFLMVFQWGVAGAALATLLAKIPCAVIAFISLTNKKNDLHIDFKRLKPEKEKLRLIAKIGLPTAIGGSTMQFGFLLMSKNVLKYGTDAMAAYGIGNKINGLISMPSNAIGSAVATIVGQNIGSGQKDRAEKAYLIARRMAVSFLLVGGFILSRRVVSESIVKIFADDPYVIQLGTDFLSLMAICCFTNGIYNSTTGLFQGSGHTFVTMGVDVTRLWVFRFLTLYICESVLMMGVESIWYSVVVSNAISAFILWVLYKTRIWEKDVIKKMNQKGA